MSVIGNPLLIGGSGGGGTVTIVDTLDAAGGTIRTITPSPNTTTIMPLSVTSNNTYTAPTGYAYSPVTVNVSGGGGSPYTLLGSAEYTVNTTSTTATNVGSINCGSSAWTSSKFILAIVYDKAGKRNGYFHSCVGLFYNFWAENGTTGSVLFTPKRTLYVYTNGGTYTQTDTVNASAYGVYPASINDNGQVSFDVRYSANGSGTINGTYKCEVWALDYPSGFTPF